ncbi:hypothetical protein [Gordonia oryzae]|uniref:hypothetical protein n=1 Tax=Gordonia oryzae TaxID=2487349 RepID=UPI000F4EA108|nr:hypothetical protein [Gordonia oryzae]
MGLPVNVKDVDDAASPGSLVAEHPVIPTPTRAAAAEIPAIVRSRYFALIEIIQKHPESDMGADIDTSVKSSSIWSFGIKNSVS